MEDQYRPIHESYFRCLYCDAEFDIPENDNLCPCCFSECIAVNNRHNISSILWKLPRRYSKLFYNGQKSVSYSTRQKKPIADRICYIIGSMYKVYYPTYWDGYSFTDDANRAVIYATVKDARIKIYKSSMGQYCYPVVVEAKLFGGRVIPLREI